MTSRTWTAVFLPALLVAIAVGPAVVPGCAPAEPPSVTDDDASSLGAPAAAAVRWPYWPERLRFHPLTRIVADERPDGHILEARVEFFDRDGHTSKASGQLRIDLHDVGPLARGVGPLATWTCDLADRAVNVEHYDVVTRTYLMRLEVGERDLAGVPELRGYFLSADGRQLAAATLRVRTP